MGRKMKVLNEDLSFDEDELIDRREVGYYATPKYVGSYIAKKMLEINSGNKVLDPCCGKEELLNVFLDNNLEVDGIDIINYKDKYECNFTQQNFIDFYYEKKKALDLTLDYDFYIANPPYNCHEVDFIKDNKLKLKKCFSDVGVHNMYSMFISALIDFAKDGAVIGLITHDSFLTSKVHKELRKKILDNCSIHEITMCPTSMFKSQGADVRTSIVILQKGLKYQKDIVINNRPLDEEILKQNLYKKQVTKFKLSEIILSTDKDNLEFVIGVPKEIKILFENLRISDMFHCITGISTGKDKLYLSKIKEEPFIIPFYKNPAKDRFFTNKVIYLHKDFLKLSQENKNFIVRNKQFLFTSGVTCSSMGVEFTASKIEKNSVFGVNANIICDEKDLWWLLGYLNSSLVTYMVRGVLIRSNMITSGYVSRIPIIEFTENQKAILENLSKKAYRLSKDRKSIKNILVKIDEFIYEVLNLSKETIFIINEFRKNILKTT